MENLHRFLRDLEDRIDESSETLLRKNWLSFADGEWKESFFRSNREEKAPSRLEWPAVMMNDALADPETMIYSELCRMNHQLAEGGPELLSYRSNYGSILLPELLGAAVVKMPYGQNSLPGCRSLSDAEAAMRSFKMTGIRPAPDAGYSRMAFETAALFQTMLTQYPKLTRFCAIYMADTEGPCGIMEMLFGSGFYYLFSDDPALIHLSMEIITDEFLLFSRAWHRAFPPFDETHRVDWGWLHRGHTLIREDTATNISRAMYDEFVFPYDAIIMREPGGGAIHFRGKGDHLMQSFDQLPGFYALNVSQPEMNDMNVVYAYSIHKGRTIFGLANAEIQRCENGGIDLLGRVQAGMGIPAWGQDTAEAPVSRKRGNQ
jgi:hypothetical protein